MKIYKMFLSVKMVSLLFILVSNSAFSYISQYTSVYRFDSRPPEEIFQTGFIPQGSNPSLYHHVVENHPELESYEERSNYVATTHDRTIAERWARDYLYLEGHGTDLVYVYEIIPNSDFYSVVDSFQSAIDGGHFSSVENNLLRRAIGNIESDDDDDDDDDHDDFEEGFAHEEEIAAMGAITTDRIVSVTGFRLEPTQDDDDDDVVIFTQNSNANFDSRNLGQLSNGEPLSEEHIFGEWFRSREDRNSIEALVNSMVEQVSSDLIGINPILAFQPSCQRSRSVHKCTRPYKVILTNDYQTGLLCLRTNQSMSNPTVAASAHINYCSDAEGEQSEWIYTSQGQFIQIMKDSRGNKNYFCLTYDGYPDKAKMTICNAKNSKQRWDFKKINAGDGEYVVLVNGDSILKNDQGVVYKVDNYHDIIINMTDPLYQFELNIKPYFYSDGDDNSILYDYDGNQFEYLEPYSDWVALRRDFYRNTYYNAHSMSLFSIREPQKGQAYSACFDSDINDSWSWVKSTDCSPISVSNSQKWIIDFTPIRRYLSYGAYYFIDQLRIKSKSNSDLFIDSSGGNNGYAFAEHPPYSGGYHVSRYRNFYSKQKVPVNSAAVENRWSSRPQSYDVFAK
ncbi:hypothetical protein BOO24_15545 [Vibrio navarrensis]|uniref:hypothetical protein n=1 Tax=Vibrio navarrensis TaxID=29495 RepID=UPI00186A5F1D|nr:hypothetical protein [Vibrio navarrensis]MBE4593746.1 hypothetical protein [Vibrio navarrensis]